MNIILQPNSNSISITPPPISKEDFANYLMDMYDLIAEENTRTVTKAQFELLFSKQLPLFLIERLYDSFLTGSSKEKTSGICKEDFARGFMGWFYGSLPQRCSLLTKLLAFHRDGFVHQKDVLLLFIHLHYKLSRHSESTHSPLQRIVGSFFNENSKLTVEEFYCKAKDTSGDMLSIALFAFVNKALFDSEALEFYQKHCYNNKKDKERERISRYLSAIECSSKEVEMSNLSNDLVDYLLMHFQESMIILKDDTCETGNEDDDLTVLDDFENDLSQVVPSSLFHMTRNSTVDALGRGKSEGEILNKLYLKESAKFYFNRLSGDSSFKVINRSKSCLSVIKHTLHKSSDNLLNLFKADVSFGKEEKTNYTFRLINHSLFFTNAKSTAFQMFFIQNSFMSTLKLGENSSKDKLYVTHIRSEINKKSVGLYFEREKEQLTFEKMIKSTLNLRDVFEDYSAIEQIGKGEFGKIVLCLSKTTKEQVVIKMIRKPSEMKDIQMVYWEIDLARLLMKVMHPNIISIKDIYECDSRYYIVSPYYSYGTLIEYDCSRNYFSYESTISIMSQLISSLVFLNQFGIMHRDIKPSNILFASPPQKCIDIKLIDFGFAKVASELSTSSEWFGSIGFSAPEITDHISYNHTIDSWSVGILCFYLIHSSIPIDDEEISATHTRTLQQFEQSQATPIAKDLLIKEKAFYQSLNCIIVSCLKQDISSRVNIKELHTMLMKPPKHTTINRAS